MTLTNDRTKLIDKVVKLLALAEGTNHSAEAETAKRMAVELMAKHNISLADAVSPESLTRFVVRLNTNKPPTFDFILLGQIAKFNGVALIQTHRRYTFVGSQADIEATLYMRDIILRQRKVAYDKWRQDYYHRTGISVVRNQTPRQWLAWHNGFTTGVTHKLHELTQLATQKVQEWGLVPVEPYKVALAHYEEQSGKTTVIGKKRRGGSAAGYEAGKNVNINKGIEAQQGVKKLN